jgi:integrase
MSKRQKRRGPNEGSIYKREKTRVLKDGTTVKTVYWTGELYFGRDDGGKKVVHRVSGKSFKEVQEKLDRLKADRTAGTLAEPSRETLAQFLEHWLRDSVKHSVRPTTFRSYESNVRIHIAPELGSLPLKKLAPAHVQQLYARKLESGLSPRSVQYIHAILHRAMGQALKWGLVPRNVCDAVDRPKAAKKQMRVLALQQVDILLQAAQGDRLEALYILAVTTGMRQGELLALCWDDIDLEGGVIHVHQQLQHLPGAGFRFSPPKSSRSRRTIKLAVMVVEALKQHRRRQAGERLALGEAWRNTHNLAFVTPVGTPLEGTNLLKRHFRPLLKKAGLPPIRFHDLRHTAATLMLQGGVHPKIVQETLGHSQISLTLDTYSHILPSMQEDAAAKMNTLLLAARKK